MFQSVHRRGRRGRRGVDGDRQMDVVFQTDGHLFGTTSLQHAEKAERGKRAGNLIPSSLQETATLKSIVSPHSVFFHFFSLLLCAILAYVVQSIHRRGRGDRRGVDGDRQLDPFLS